MRVSVWTTFWFLCPYFSRRSRRVRGSCTSVVAPRVYSVDAPFSLANALSIRNSWPEVEFCLPACLLSVCVSVLLSPLFFIKHLFLQGEKFTEDRARVKYWNLSSLSAFVFHGHRFALTVNNSPANPKEKRQIFILPLGDFFKALNIVLKTGKVVKAGKQKGNAYKPPP